MADGKKAETLDGVENSNSESMETPSVNKSEEKSPGDVNAEDSLGTAAGIQEVSLKGDAPEQAEVDGSQLSEDTDQKESNAEEDSNVSGEGDGDAEENEWLDILGSGHLKKKVLRAGKEGTRPNRSLSMTVRFKGCLTDGTEVESHDSYNFLQGEGEVIQAVDLCVCLMDIGEVAEVHSNSRFAYGEYGKPPIVPPNADMVFEIELLEVTVNKSILEMTVEELCQMADKRREYGNELFSYRNYSGAVHSYSRAVKILEEGKTSSEEEEKMLHSLQIKCHNNLAAAQLKIEAYAAALKSCDSALLLDPNNVKALFRKGKVLAGLKEVPEAITMMKKALAIEPVNKTIHQELSKLASIQQEEVREEKELYQRMVGDMAKVADPSAAGSGKTGYGAKTMLFGLAVVIAVVAVALALNLH